MCFQHADRVLDIRCVCVCVCVCVCMCVCVCVLVMYVCVYVSTTNIYIYPYIQAAYKHSHNQHMQTQTHPTGSGNDVAKAGTTRMMRAFVAELVLTVVVAEEDTISTMYSISMSSPPPEYDFVYVICLVYAYGVICMVYAYCYLLLYVWCTHMESYVWCTHIVICCYMFGVRILLFVVMCMV